MFIYSCIFVVPVVATVYEDEVVADLGEVAVMSCMVAGQPIYNAYIFMIFLYICSSCCGDCI